MHVDSARFRLGCFAVIFQGDKVLLCRRNDFDVWNLPGGGMEKDESVDEAVIREVKEETGLEVKTQCFIDSIQYWFVRPNDGVRCHKTVLYYLMDPVGGDTSLHDHEFDEARWFTAEDALKTMSYGNEAKVVEKGLSLAVRR